MADLRVRIASLELKNPVLVASGTFGYGQESADLADLDALGGLITKSVTLHARAGNPPVRIAELPAGMLNSIGLANVGLQAFVRDKLPFLRTLRTALIVNVAGSTAEEFLQVIRALNDEDGIAAYELNFSCPNVKEGGLAFSQDARVTARLTRMLAKASTRPVVVKLTPNVTDIAEIACAAAENGADALSLINTVVGMAVDVKNRRPRIHTVTGGYSGPAIKPIALAKLWEVRQRVSVPLIGIGGIMTVEDALEFLMTGASAIQVGTANFIDPATGPRIAEQLREYCREHGLASISEVVGSLRV